jgi:hypothetical protein
MIKTNKILTRAFALKGTNATVTIPDNKTIMNALKSRPINSLPSITIIL